MMQQLDVAAELGMGRMGKNYKELTRLNNIQGNRCFKGELCQFFSLLTPVSYMAPFTKHFIGNSV